LERIRVRAETVTRGFTTEDWQNARPETWSASAILEHLILSFRGTTKAMLSVLQMPEPVCPPVFIRHRIAQFYVVQLGIFPRGMKSPKGVIPSGNTLDAPLRRFNDALVAMDATLNDAERRLGKKSRLLEHPVLGPLTAEQWRKFHRVHARHHLKQIAALRAGMKKLRISA
jgi:hypothetical protein